jgi:DNA replication protein DnaC
MRHPDDPCPYGLCDGDGFAIDEATNTASPCRCRPERVALRKARKMEAQTRRAVPRRYRELSWDRHPLNEIVAVHPSAAREVERYVAELPERLERGDGLWLWGSKGTGKTSLAYYVSAVAARRGHTVLSWNTITLLNDLRDSFDADHRGAATHEIVDAACSVDLLQLEDLSAARTSEWVLEQLYAIVNRRYEEQRAIVFTSDAPSDAPEDPFALAERVGERTFSRLLAMCGDPVVMIGEDMRVSKPAPATTPSASPQGWLQGAVD